MSEPSPPPRAPRRRGCVLILVGLTVVFAVYGWMFFSDPSELDDADLRLEYPAVAPELNAYTWLERAQSSRGPDLSYQPETISKLIDENRKAYAFLLKAAACEVYVPASITGLGFDLDPVFEPRENGELFHLFGTDAHERHDLEQLWACIAAERKLTALRSEWPMSQEFGNTGDDRTMEYLTRRAIELQDSAIVLRRWLEDFRSPLLAPDWRERALRARYEGTALYLRGPQVARDLRSFGGLHHPLLLRPNRTIAMYGEQVREQLKTLDEPAVAPTYQAPSFFRKLRWALGGNYSGEQILDASKRMSAWHPGELDRSEELANDALLRTALALRIYLLENGSYPISLEELVPDLLSAVPIDPNDESGKPIRWDAERCMLWSVGKDGVDDDGPAHPTHGNGTITAVGTPDCTLVLPTPE